VAEGYVALGKLMWSIFHRYCTYVLLLCYIILFLTDFDFIPSE